MFPIVFFPKWFSIIKFYWLRSFSIYQDEEDTAPESLETFNREKIFKIKGEK